MVAVLGWSGIFVFFSILSQGAAVVTGDSEAMGYALWFSLLAFVPPAIGFGGDWLYNKKVDAGKAKERLPFHLRWDGWEPGHMGDDDPEWVNSYFYNWRTGKAEKISQHVFLHERLSLPPQK
jgi:hypothetical protein